MRIALSFALVVVLLCVTRGFGGVAHPQDGPHADLRVAIEDDLVRFSVGVNLAFLDETVDVSREALGVLSEREAEALLGVYQEYLSDQVSCVINGERVEPEFERIEIFTHPDPGLLAIFPKMGARALIRAAVVMRFDSSALTETVEITWPSYPYDLLAAEMEGASATPARMYFEVVLTANGKTVPSRFTHAEPTLRWSREDSDEPNQLENLPGPVVVEPAQIPVLTVVLASIVVVTGVGWVICWKSQRKGTRALGVGSAVTFVVLVAQLALGGVGRRGVSPMISDEDAAVVLRSLHRSICSFRA